MSEVFVFGTPLGGGGGGSGTIVVEEEGVVQVPDATILNFTGAVTVAPGSGTAVINITAGGNVFALNTFNEEEIIFGLNDATRDVQASSDFIYDTVADSVRALHYNDAVLKSQYLAVGGLEKTVTLGNSILSDYINPITSYRTTIQGANIAQTLDTVTDFVSFGSDIFSSAFMPGAFSSNMIAIGVDICNSQVDSISNGIYIGSAIAPTLNDVSDSSHNVLLSHTALSTATKISNTVGVGYNIGPAIDESYNNVFISAQQNMGSNGLGIADGCLLIGSSSDGLLNFPRNTMGQPVQTQSFNINGTYYGYRDPNTTHVFSRLGGNPTNSLNSTACLELAGYSSVLLVNRLATAAENAIAANPDLANGGLWYNSDSNTFRVRQNGVITSVITADPHTTLSYDAVNKLFPAFTLQPMGVIGTPQPLAVPPGSTVLNPINNPNILYNNGTNQFNFTYLGATAILQIYGYVYADSTGGGATTDQLAFGIWHQPGGAGPITDVTASYIRNNEVGMSGVPKAYFYNCALQLETNDRIIVTQVNYMTTNAIRLYDIKINFDRKH